DQDARYHQVLLPQVGVVLRLQWVTKALPIACGTLPPLELQLDPWGAKCTASSTCRKPKVHAVIVHFRFVKGVACHGGHRANIGLTDLFLLLLRVHSTHSYVASPSTSPRINVSSRKLATRPLAPLSVAPPPPPSPIKQTDTTRPFVTAPS